MTRRRVDGSKPGLALTLAFACAISTVTACGKKGPPQAPFVRIPAAVQRVTAARLGRDIYVSLTVPAANVDRSTPVDLDYIDLYAFTAMAAPLRATLVDEANRIARVRVAPAPVDAEAAPPAAPGAVVPGAVITVIDTGGEPAQAGLSRFYLAIPFSSRGRPGAQHTPVEVPFASVPPSPAAPELSVTPAGAVNVAWIAAPAAAATPASRINVYRVPSAPAAPPTGSLVARPAPLNMMPLAASPFSEPARMGEEVCYVLRTVTGEGLTALEGEPSPQTCITPVDRFPPAAPTQLVATAGAGSISLLWEANAEPDLAGYLVLRGAPGDARLQPLTPTPTTDVRYTDTTVVPGMRYVYAVVAVDTQMPTPNVSPESARVEETAQ